MNIKVIVWQEDDLWCATVSQTTARTFRIDRDNFGL